jgi:hypothetical protein
MTLAKIAIHTHGRKVVAALTESRIVTPSYISLLPLVLGATSDVPVLERPPELLAQHWPPHCRLPRSQARGRTARPQAQTSALARWLRAQSL